MDSTSGVWYDLKCFTLATSLPNGGVRDFLEKFKAPAILIAELLKVIFKNTNIQPTLTCSKSRVEIPGHYVKSVQS